MNRHISEVEALMDTRNPKWAAIYEKHTNGINYGIDTNQIINQLEKWDSRYGISISEVDHNRLMVKFASLPDDLSGLAKEVYQLCPDIIDQHFGCMDEMVEMMETQGQPLNPELAAMIEGVSFEDDNFGIVLLQKSLKSSKSLALWWD